MTNSEFNIWLEDLFATFPRIGSYIDSLDGGSSDSQASTRTTDIWERELAKAELDDALEVTRRMLRGVEGYQPPAEKGKAATWSFQEEKIPVYVARWCERVKSERITALLPRESDRMPDKAILASMRSICAETEKRALRGENIHAIVNELCPVDERELRRYRCLLCEDRGLVWCWHPRSMRLAATGKLDRPHSGGVYTTMVRCKCHAGDQHEAYSLKDATKKNGVRETPVIFNEREWLTFEHTEGPNKYRGNSQEGIDRLNLFMMNYVPSNGCVEVEF